MKKIIAFILVVVITCNLFAQQVFADPETLDPPVTAGTVEDDHDDPNGGDDESAAGAYGMYDADEDDTAPYISNYELLTIMTTLQGEMTNLQNEMASCGKRLMTVKNTKWSLLRKPMWLPGEYLQYY